ncbi:MAG: apolipoprotein N-acyltransferase [Aquabacterium sp.]|uniref:apolipoprotein N-acyltransferase n=1 Tax=Aquabacterium sp. TaxID=1872578 RepID=UPI0027194564|nr:apolipoprotein N-acyltransferase [Aquabacterium sp.]MDO9003844.1 apolipoprotein N-acyltransferase [Aquabacterium sp.]
MLASGAWVPPGGLRVGKALLLSMLAGALLAGAFSPWIDALGTAWPATLLSLAVMTFVGVLRSIGSVSLAAKCGALFGTVWLVSGTGWMFVSLHQFGGLPAWLAGLSVLVLCAALSGFMALAAAAWVGWRRGHWLSDGVLLAALWWLAEWIRGCIFTGFPWAASGYALVDSPLAVLAPWIGVYAMGAVWVLMLSWVVLSAPRWRSMLVSVLALLLLVGSLSFIGGRPWHEFTRAHGAPLSVTLLQGNIPQDEKFAQSHLIDQLVWHARQLVAAKGDLVVAPETAIPLLPDQMPEGYWAELASAFHVGDRAALIGLPLGDFERGYTNSVVGLSSATKALPDGFYRYNKHHLVPFGEFIPLGFHWFVQMMNMPLGDFTRGPRAAPSFGVKGQWVAPTICYEDLFGEELAQRFVTPGQPAPTVFANVSNLAWFGDTVAIYQHLQIARMRSLEFQLPTIRATNTGATVVIDHTAKVTAALPTNTRGALVASVQGRMGNTPYAEWAGRFGLWPVVALAALAVLALKRRSRSPSASL